MGRILAKVREAIYTIARRLWIAGKVIGLG